MATMLRDTFLSFLPWNIQTYNISSILPMASAILVLLLFFRDLFFGFLFSGVAYTEIFLFFPTVLRFF